MTNPNNSVGTNAAYDGRTSVNAFNDVLGLLPRGVLSGWACVPKSGLTVSLGGVSGTRDVAIAEGNNGNRTTINNIPGTPIDVTISAAPGANSRIDLIVAYVDNPPTGVSTTADNPSACGLITVEGTAAATPTAPDDSDIRTAITADGASGTTAYYVVLAQVTIPSGTTDIDNSMISSGGNSGIRSQNIDFTTFTKYASLDNNVTLTNVGGYNYTKIPGTEITVNVKAGETYLIMGTACVYPSNFNEVYLRTAVNNTQIGASAVAGGIDSWTPLSKMTPYMAATDGTAVFSLFSGAGGVSSTNVDILSGSTIFVMRVG